MTRFNTVHRGFTRCIIVHIYRWKNDCFTRNGNGRRRVVWCFTVVYAHSPTSKQEIKCIRWRFFFLNISLFFLYITRAYIFEIIRRCNRSGSQNIKPDDRHHKHNRSMKEDQKSVREKKVTKFKSTWTRVIVTYILVSCGFLVSHAKSCKGGCFFFPWVYKQ